MLQAGQQIKAMAQGAADAVKNATGMNKWRQNMAALLSLSVLSLSSTVPQTFSFCICFVCFQILLLESILFGLNSLK